MFLTGIRLLAALLFLSIIPATHAQDHALFDPPAVYLTWQQDPTTTMTVHWHTQEKAPSKLEYRNLNESQWRDMEGSSVPMPDDPKPRTIHTAEITKLSPDTDYVFRFGQQSKEFKFRTMPKSLEKPVRFIEGGDVFHQREWMDKMNALSAKHDPAFVVFGGDLAYSNNRNTEVENVARWYEFFDSWKKKSVAPDGRLIPMLVTLGNHEVKGFWGKPVESAPCFYALFAMPGKQGYNVLDFGKYMSLFLLDSGHTHPIAGAQTEWLKDALSKRKKVPHLFPIYHVPAFPSVREYEAGENSDLSQQVRSEWVPLFEEYGVGIGFEHHDHAFKRTHPMRNGKIDHKGTVYLGDGAWGVNLRGTHPIEKTWYLDKAGKVRHFFLVTVSEKERSVQAIDETGKVFDELRQPVRR